MNKKNHVPLMGESKTGCCALIQPSDWDEQTFVFEDKLFAKATSRNFWHIPLTLGSAMKRTQEKITAADAQPSDVLILSTDVSPWKSEHFFAVTKEVPGLKMVRLSGTFLAKVFEGPYREVPKWYARLITYARDQGYEPKRVYFFYTECPKCIKAYGKNYVVGFAQVA